MDDKNYVNREILRRIIELFVIKEKRQRLLEFMESPKRYDDFLHGVLRDTRNLKPECMIELPDNQQTVEIVLQKLRKLGAGKKAYLVSADDEVDGKTGRI